MTLPDDDLISAYSQINQPLDQLPYTRELDLLIRLAAPAGRIGDEIRRLALQQLLRLRKRGRLPRLRRSWRMRRRRVNG